MPSPQNERRSPAAPTAGPSSEPIGNAPILPDPRCGFQPTFATIPVERFGEIGGRSTLYVGRARPEWFSVAALRALPGRRITWAIGARGPARERAVAHAVARSEPGDLIVIVEDLDTADAWYQASLRADGVTPPWMGRRADA